jgi:glycosyltransferase involved in cell wall biosynthesis
MTPRPAVVRQIHQSRHLVRRADLAWLYRRTDALVVGANQWKAKLVENFGLDPAKVIVIPPGVDTDRFKPDGDVEVIRREIGAQPGDKLIGMVSRIKASRGHELALQAFQHVRAKQPRAHLLFVGRGEGREALEREVARLDLASSVHFLGYRADDLPAIYRALDVHLLLGEGSDGSCRAALEAMACGAPVVALRVGTLTESLAEGCTGFFADPSADDLAAKILHVLEQPLARETIRAHAVANFSIAPRVDLAENLFMRLTDRR